MYCSSCGQRIGDGDRFCCHCGAAQSSLAAASEAKDKSTSDAEAKAESFRAFLTDETDVCSEYTVHNPNKRSFRFDVDGLSFGTLYIWLFFLAGEMVLLKSYSPDLGQVPLRGDVQAHVYLAMNKANRISPNGCYFCLDENNNLVARCGVLVTDLPDSIANNLVLGMVFQLLATWEQGSSELIHLL